MKPSAALIAAGKMMLQMLGVFAEFEHATVEALEVERRGLAARKARLTIPPVDKEALSGIPSEFEETMAKGTNPQKKKHLFRRVVKKVLIHDRRTIEVWYGLPSQASVRTPGHLAPWMCQYAISPRADRTRRLLPDKA